MPLPEKQLIERDAKRDIGAELLKAAREMKAGKGNVLRVRSAIKQPYTESGIDQVEMYCDTRIAELEGANNDVPRALVAKARKRIKASNKNR